MQFTLDSVAHAIACIEQANKGKSVDKTPVILNDLNDLTNVANRFFFGVLTVGTGVIKGVLKDENDQEIITIDENSQIIMLFSSVECLDGADAVLLTPLGHFRGFEINLR